MSPFLEAPGIEKPDVWTASGGWAAEVKVSARLLTMRFADLDLAAIAQRRDGRDRQIVLWYFLRARDETGTGHISRDQVQDAARWLGWSARMTARMLGGGDDVFWTIAQDGFIYMRSAAKIATALGSPFRRSRRCGTGGRSRTRR